MKRKTLLIYASSLLFIVAIVVSSAYLLIKPGFVYRVYLDGRDLGTVADLDDYSATLTEMLAKEEAEAGLSLAIAQEVTAQREFQWNPQANYEEVRAALIDKLSFITVGWGIVTGDECLAWIATKDQAQHVLELVAGHFVPESSNRQLVSTEIIDDVEICSQEVSPEEVIDVDSAVALILQGGEKIETYVVSRGDSLWSISRSANVSQSELREANPALAESDILHTGQALNLVKAEPKLSVRTVANVFAKESIQYSTSYKGTSSLWYYQSKTSQNGVKGKREVTYEVEYLNGIEMGRAATASRVVSQPVTRIVQRGTSRWPSKATGMFRWPLNSGTITDRFGVYRTLRGERHRGVDIGAPRGTSIHASASGTVSTVAYNKSYGNYVVIEHSNGYSTLYAHASSLLVHTGQRVSKGDVIARVGNTGLSTGNHLHFEVRRYCNPINPLQFFKP